MKFTEADHERIKRAAADTWEHVDAVQPRLVKDARQERSQTSRDLWALQHKQQVILARDYESNGESGV